MTDATASLTAPPAAAEPPNKLGFWGRRHAANAAEGYRVDYKYLGLAYLIEIIVAGTSIGAGIYFATEYGTSTHLFWVMMMAPIAYACVELARVPLAFALRIQRSWFWKTFLVLMVLCAAAVTVKSLSQVGELMFRPRLEKVALARAALDEAGNARKNSTDDMTAADNRVQRAKDEIERIDKNILDLSDKSTKITGKGTQDQRVVRNKQGRVIGTNKTTSYDPRLAASAKAVERAQTDRKVAAAEQQEAIAARQGLIKNNGQAEADYAKLEREYSRQVMQSQMHSFAAMVFGPPKTPADGDAHVATIMRFFVFFPAIFASLTATALALASVNHLPKKKQDDVVELDRRAAQYVYEPLSDAITARAVEEALKAVKKAQEPAEAKPAEAKPEPAVAESPQAPIQPAGVHDSNVVPLVAEGRANPTREKDA